MAHPLYKLCTPKEQAFLQHFARTKDLYTSIAESYSHQQVQSVVKSIRQNELLTTMIDMISGSPLPSKEDGIRMAWKIVQGCKTPHEAWRGFEIISDMAGWGVEKVKPDEQTEKRLKAKEIDELRQRSSSN